MPDRTGLPAGGAPLERLLPLDWLRGVVMVLMALDHVDAASNPRHAQGDSAAWISPFHDSAPDFLTRWCTHLCAPTFFLLCGAGIALSRAKGRARGESDAAFDRHLLARGIVLIVLEVTLVSYYWRAAAGAGGPRLLPVFLQVLWALGAGMVLMVPLRRLAGRAQVVAAAALLVGAEVAYGASAADGPRGGPLLQWLVTGGLQSWTPKARGEVPFDVLALYPVLPWLPAMLLGHLLGRLAGAGRLTARGCLLAAGFACAVFAALRGLDGFGNLGLHRRSAGALEWLHCSKYPPSVTFLAMELGLALLLLAALQRGERWLARLPAWNPLEVLGQTALFFYLLHLPMIAALQGLGALPARGAGSAGHSWLGALVVSAACWPLCAGYRAYQRRWRHRWTRFL